MLPESIMRCMNKNYSPQESRGFIYSQFQGMVGCTPIPTYPYRKSLYKPYIVGISGSESQRIRREHGKYQGQLWKNPEFISEKQHTRMIFFHGYRIFSDSLLC